MPVQRRLLVYQRAVVEHMTERLQWARSARNRKGKAVFEKSVLAKGRTASLHLVYVV